MLESFKLHKQWHFVGGLRLRSSIHQSCAISQNRKNKIESMKPVAGNKFYQAILMP